MDDPRARAVMLAGAQSFGWSSYPVFRLEDVPIEIDIDVLPKPGEPSLGVAEASQGPASAALADATGRRFRDMPITPETLRRALVTL